jgi:hypothetical protein
MVLSLDVENIEVVVKTCFERGPELHILELEHTRLHFIKPKFVIGYLRLGNVF